MTKSCVFLIALVAHYSIVHAQWGLTGNAGTNPPTNFLGTTDAKSLLFKVNGQQAGLLDYNSATGNAVFGYQALLSSTGTSNTGVGYQALFSNTSGSNNDAFGYKALYSNTTANANSAFGNNALYSNTTGYNNSAFGLYALYSNSTGTYNFAAGASSLFTNTSGNYNTAAGYSALRNNTTANGNVAVGNESLYSNTTGTANTGNGFWALHSNTTGSNNTAIGVSVLTTMNGADDNTAVGDSVLWQNTSGYNNTAVGYAASWYNTTGYQNTAIGSGAIGFNTTGYNNTAFGMNSNWNASDAGTYNTDLGTGVVADPSGNFATNTTGIGSATATTASNQVMFGYSTTTSIGGYANWSNISDGRFKRNVKENVPGLSFISLLRPVTYNLDVAGINEYLRPVATSTPHRMTSFARADETAVKEKEKIVHTGFIAQDVDSTARKLNYDFSGVDIPKNNKELYSLRYSDFVVPLVKAVQELSSVNDSLRTRVSALRSEIIKIRQLLESK